MTMFAIGCAVFAAGLMLWASWVDWRRYEIPYVSIVGVGLFGLMYRYDLGDFKLEVFMMPMLVGSSLLVLALIMQWFRKKPVLGYGDLQLFVASLLWIDVSQLPLFFVMAGLIGLLLACLSREEGYFPFGPAIASAWFASFI
jgi:prepilin signal peptidase PulO-like enzyme (type II secretory pathway)